MNKKQIKSIAKAIRERQNTIMLEPPETVNGRLVFSRRRAHVTDQVARQFKDGAAAMKRIQADPMKAGYYCATYDMILAIDVLLEQPFHWGLEYLEDMKAECDKFFRQHPKGPGKQKRRGPKIRKAKK